MNRQELVDLLKKNGVDVNAFGIGKAKKVDEFLKKGNKVQVELILRGRQMTMKHLGREKVKKFLEFIKEPSEPEGEIKSQGRSLNLIVKRK